MTISELVKEAHETARSNGFYDNEKDLYPSNKLIPEKLCLIHSEVSEALEAYRRGEEDFWFNDDKPEGILSELADVLIRVGDMCGFYGWDLQDAVKEKMAYNKTRSHRHGGKRV